VGACVGAEQLGRPAVARYNATDRQAKERILAG
jgi:hypothetical protein